MAGFKVRDLRNKGFFLLDDAYLNGYARLFDTTTTAVYLSLCRHADKEQSSFPSQQLIAQEHNLNERTVRRKIQILLAHNIIRVEKVRSNKGKWLNNTYFLLDKSEWYKPIVIDGEVVIPSRGHGSPVDQPEDTGVQTRGHGSPIKDTHKKETHTPSIVSPKRSLTRSYPLEDISDQDLEEISEKYRIPLAFVRLSLERLRNYCDSSGKHYKDYKAALRNFVLGDAQRQLERRGSDDRKRAIDASGL